MTLAHVYRNQPYSSIKGPSIILHRAGIANQVTSTGHADHCFGIYPINKCQEGNVHHNLQICHLDYTRTSSVQCHQQSVLSILLNGTGLYNFSNVCLSECPLQARLNFWMPWIVSHNWCLAFVSGPNALQTVLMQSIVADSLLPQFIPCF